MQASKAGEPSWGWPLGGGMWGRDARTAPACTGRPRGQGCLSSPLGSGMGPPRGRQGCTLPSASEEYPPGSPSRQPRPIISAWAFHMIRDSARRTSGVAARFATGFTPADRLLGTPSLLGLLTGDQHPPLRGEVTVGAEPGLTEGLHRRLHTDLPRGRTPTITGKMGLI